VNLTYQGIIVSTSNTQVKVVSGPIKAAISGSVNQMRAGELLSLDASSSYDTDKQPQNRSTSGLLFSWTCMQLAPVLNKSCSSIFEQSFFRGSASSVSVLLRANIDAENTMAMVTVTVSDATNALRTESTSRTLIILSPKYPLIGIESSASNGHFNQMESLTLKGEINLPPLVTGNASWIVVSGGSAKLLSYANAPVKQSFVGSLETFLVIPRNLLLPGNSYTFGLISFLSNQEILGSNTISVSVNAPPSPGRFSMSPLSGREVIDPFTWTCSRWTGADLPLSYQFSYVSSSGNSVVIQSLSSLTMATAGLPAGSPSNSGMVLCVADVFDNLRANSTITRAVQVNNTIISPASFTSLILANSDPRTFATVDGLVKGTAVATYLLNKANCSLAPVDCGILNRLPCFSISHSCGSCLPGFSSISIGDGNEKCFKEIPAISSVLKTCPANCSSNGRCVAYAVATNDIVDRCNEGDLSCSVRCLCNANYRLAANCDLTDDEIAARRTLRDNVVTAMASYFSQQNANEQVVSGWVGSINEVAQVPNELSGPTIDSLLALSSYVLAVAASEGYNSYYLADYLTGLDSISSAVSSISDTETTRNNATSGTVLFLLQNYSKLLLEEMVPGQSAIDQVLNNLKMHVERPKLSENIVTKGRRFLADESDCRGNMSVSLPQRLWEKATNQPATTLLVRSCLSNISSIGMTAVAVSSAVYRNPSYRSDSLSLSLSRVPSCFSANRTDCALSMETRSDNSGMGLLYSSVNRTVLCEEDDLTTHSVSCPDGKNYSVACQGRAETIIFHCPRVSREPQCQLLVPSASSFLQLRDVGCRAIEVSSGAIQCSCPLLAVNASGPSSAADEGYSVSYVALMKNVEETFVNTVISAEDINGNVLKKSWQALVTVCSLFLGILLAIGFSVRADSQVKNAIEAEEQMVKHAKAHTFLQRKSQIQRSQRFIRVPSVKDLTKARERNVFVLAEQALPQILSSQSFQTKLWHEIKRFHRWMGVVYYYSPDFPRALRVISLSSNIIIMLFIQSLTYNFTHEDDGTCETLKTQETCLAPRSVYGTGDARCYWKASSSAATGRCAYLYPENSMQIVLFVAIFSALVSTPLALAVDWILHRILAAPTLDGSVDNDENEDQGDRESAFVRALTEEPPARPPPLLSLQSFRAPNGGRAAFAAVSKYRQLVENDFEQLLKELLEYRGSVTNLDHRREFDCKRPQLILIFLVHSDYSLLSR
jgi:hypothetical protein